MNFCPGCGKEIEGRFCPDCRPLKKLTVKDIDIDVCVECGKYHRRNSWRKRDIMKGIEEITRDSIREDVKKIEPIVPPLTPKPGLDIEFEVIVHTGDGKAILPGMLHYTYCDVCAKKGTDYFEGVLQLRNPSKVIVDEIYSYVKNNAVFITKEAQKKDAMDFYMTDQHKLQALGKHLQNTFGGSLKSTAKLFSKDRQTSKDIHRVTVLYRAPDFGKGDVIKMEDKIVHITSMGKTIHGTDLKTGKRVSLDLKDKEYDIMKPQKTRVSKVYPEVEVLDPETYQSMPVANKRDVQAGEKVKVVKDKSYYIL